MIKLLIFLLPFAMAEEIRDAVMDVNFSQLTQSVSRVWGRDPFLKSAGFYPGIRDPDKMTLQGIIYENKQPLAIINGVRVNQNSIFMGKRVQQIGPNFVILADADSLLELVLPPARKGQPRELYIEEIDDSNETEGDR